MKSVFFTIILGTIATLFLASPNRTIAGGGGGGGGN